MNEITYKVIGLLLIISSTEVDIVQFSDAINIIVALLLRTIIIVFGLIMMDNAYEIKYKE